MLEKHQSSLDIQALNMTLLSSDPAGSSSKKKMAPLTSEYLLGTPAGYVVKIDPVKGRCLFAEEGAEEGQPAIKAGQLILEERPCIIGPKQTSPLVCVECSRTLLGETSGEITNKIRRHIAFFLFLT